MEAVMNKAYDFLPVADKGLVDDIIDLLQARHEKNRKETLEAIDDANRGNTIGPFYSVADLMASLNAED